MCRSIRLVLIGGATFLVGIAGLLEWLGGAPAAPAEKTSLVEFTRDGKLKQPGGYRKWVCAGDVITPNDMNGGEASFPEFHAVYMDPESIADYEKIGKFRDGTVLKKELGSVGSKEAPGGKGYVQGQFTGVELDPAGYPCGRMRCGMVTTQTTVPISRTSCGSGSGHSSSIP